MKMNNAQLLKSKGPYVFNPRVTPDPLEAERLEAKLRDAAERLADYYGRKLVQSSNRPSTTSA